MLNKSATLNSCKCKLHRDSSIYQSETIFTAILMNESLRTGLKSEIFINRRAILSNMYSVKMQIEGRIKIESN